MLYYFKDKDNQDEVVKVSAMKRMFLQLGTPDSLKREVALTNAGNHVLASPIKSKDVENVKKEIDKFAGEILKMQSCYEPVRKF
jgi:hypothetical protein